MTFSTKGLIRAVFARPPLWNTSNPKHNNREVTRVLWEEVKQMFGFKDVELVKKKWKNIKDHYRKELKKIPPGRLGEPGHQFLSQWRHFNQMAFMKDLILAGRTAKDDTETKNSTTDSDNDSDSDKALDEGKNPVNPTSSTSISSTNKSRKRKQEEDSHSAFLQLEKKKLSIFEEKQKEGTQKSDDYNFLMSLLPQMEKFTTIQKFRVRNEINSIMLAELEQGSCADTQYGYKTPRENYY